PRLRMALDWPVTPHIKIGSGMSVGFRKYFSGEGEDDWILTEDGGISTGINADFFIGEGVLRLSNEFRRDADTLELLRESGNDDYARNLNVFSARYSVDLTPYISLIVQGTQENTWVSPSRYEYQDNVRNTFHINTPYRINRALRLGPYVRWEHIDYEESDNLRPFGVYLVPEEKADRTTPEAGISFLYQPEDRLLTVEGSLGYEWMDVDETNPLVDDEEDGVTGNLTVHYPTSEFTTHSLSVSHGRKQAITSLFANYSEDTRYTYAIRSNIMSDVTVSGSLSYLNVRESDFGETADIYRAGVGTSYQFTRKLKGSARYEYVTKNSNQAGSDYDRNQVRLTMHYDF
ncbi:MAG: outer membrane beta-barrel protein, partial [Verrucomicrobiota bacterium]